MTIEFESEPVPPSPVANDAPMVYILAITDKREIVR